MIVWRHVKRKKAFFLEELLPITLRQIVAICEESPKTLVNLATVFIQELRHADEKGEADEDLSRKYVAFLLEALERIPLAPTLDEEWTALRERLCQLILACGIDFQVILLTLPFFKMFQTFYYADGVAKEPLETSSSALQIEDDEEYVEVDYPRLYESIELTIRTHKVTFQDLPHPLEYKHLWRSWIRLTKDIATPGDRDFDPAINTFCWSMGGILGLLYWSIDREESDKIFVLFQLSPIQVMQLAAPYLSHMFHEFASREQWAIGFRICEKLINMTELDTIDLSGEQHLKEWKISPTCHQEGEHEAHSPAHRASLLWHWSFELLESLISKMVHLPQPQDRRQMYDLLQVFLDRMTLWTRYQMLQYFIHWCPYPNVTSLLIDRLKKDMIIHWKNGNPQVVPGQLIAYLFCLFRDFFDSPEENELNLSHSEIYISLLSFSRFLLLREPQHEVSTPLDYAWTRDQKSAFQTQVRMIQNQVTNALSSNSLSRDEQHQLNLLQAAVDGAIDTISQRYI